MYIHCDILTIHLKMTKGWLECHVLQFILNLFQMFYEIIYCVYIRGLDPTETKHKKLPHIVNFNQ